MSCIQWTRPDPLYKPVHLCIRSVERLLAGAGLCVEVEDSEIKSRTNAI